MKLKSFLMSLLAFAFVLSAVGTQAADAGLNPYLATGAITTLVVALKIFAPETPLYADRMGIDVVNWVGYIIEKFYKNNAFLLAAYSDDEYVVDGKYVVLPQAGGDPVVTKNRSQFPAPITNVTDSSVVYQLDVYRTDPQLITNAELIEISYPKIDSVLGRHVNKLSEDAANDIIIKWATDLPQDKYILTTGANTDLLSGSQTGTRKVFVYDNLKLAKRLMDNDNVPSENRSCLITANHLDELTTSFSINQFALFSSGYNAATGVIGELFGFKFYQRSSVAILSAAGPVLTIKPWQSASEAADRDGTICFQMDAVTKAQGSIDFFEDLRTAANYGDVYSSELRCGGRRRFADSKGIYIIAAAAGV